MEKSIYYPKKHEELLRKAGLIGTGYLEVKAIHKFKNMQVSEDGITFTEVKRPEIDDIAIGQTTAVFDRSGFIAGYWANGLTVEERKIINEECGVPYIYLAESINPATGKPFHPDTTFTVKEGDIYDLSNPRDVALVRCLFEVVSTIGKDKNEALDNGAMFYFYSKEEEKKEKEKEIKRRKGAAQLVDKLSKSEKRQIVRILILDGDYPADPHVSEEIAEEIFDEAAFSLPFEVLKAHDTENKENYICCKLLLHSGHIEASSIDGPFYKNPTVYGQKTHLADSFSELMKKIDQHKDLINAFRSMENIVVRNNVIETETYVRNAASVSFLSKHGIGNSKSDVSDAPVISHAENTGSINPDAVKFMSIEKVIEALNREGVEHGFDKNSNLKEAKQFLIEYIKDK
jgi:hypothetical protein